MLTNEYESIQETSTKSETDMAFDSVIWANSLRGTGNTEYQNEFYERQARKLRRKYEDLLEGRD